PSGGLMRVPADGGEPRALTMPREASGEVRHAWPSLVPGRRLLLFTIDTSSIDEAPGLMGVLSLDTASGAEPARWQTLVAGVNLARAAAADTIVFSRGAELHAVAFDPLRQALAGAPRLIAGSVAVARGRAQYALSSTGVLSYVAAGDPASGGLMWLTGGAS